MNTIQTQSPGSTRIYCAIFALLLFCACKAESPLGGSSNRPVDPLETREFAYAFELPDLDGVQINLRDYRGQLVLLNFWATWCPPCVAEMPALQRLHQEFNSEGFSVVSINVDPKRSHAQVRDFIKEKSITFPVLLDPDMSVPPEYAVSGFPESFFMDKNGRLLRVDDPKTGSNILRIISEREWDSPSYKSLVASLLDLPTPNTLDSTDVNAQQHQEHTNR